MTVLHDYRYLEASQRNLANFFKRKGTKTNGVEQIRTAEQAQAYFMGMELKDLKHHVGVRAKDNAHDKSLEEFLTTIHAQAKKAGLKSTFKKKAGHAASDVVDALIAAGLAERIEVALVVTPKKVVVKSVEATPTHLEDRPVEKKINPKKAARLAAAEAIGSAPNKTQKVNADARRAEVMASKAQRQPRILAKK